MIGRRIACATILGATGSSCPSNQPRSPPWTTPLAAVLFWHCVTKAASFWSSARCATARQQWKEHSGKFEIVGNDIAVPGVTSSKIHAARACSRRAFPKRKWLDVCLENVAQFCFIAWFPPVPSHTTRIKQQDTIPRRGECFFFFREPGAQLAHGRVGGLAIEAQSSSFQAPSLVLCTRLSNDS